MTIPRNKAPTMLVNFLGRDATTVAVLRIYCYSYRVHCKIAALPGRRKDACRRRTTAKRQGDTTTLQGAGALGTGRNGGPSRSWQKLIKWRGLGSVSQKYQPEQSQPLATRFLERTLPGANRSREYFCIAKRVTTHVTS